MPVSNLTPGSSINDPKVSAPKSRSTFQPSYRNLLTSRFGEYTPFFAMETVANEKVYLHSVHNLQTMNLKSPLLSGLAMKKDYFAVPFEAILPLNWEKVFTQPNIGDDVPDGVNCTLKGLGAKVLTHFNQLITRFGAEIDDTEYEKAMKTLIQLLVYGEYFYSSGSLLAVTEYRLDSSFRIDGFRADEFLPVELDNASYDSLFDQILMILDKYLRTVNSFEVQLLDIDGTPGDKYVVVDSGYQPSARETNYINLRRLLEIVRDHPSFKVLESPFISSSGVLDEIFQGLDNSVITCNTDTDLPFNASWVMAYQIICNHFYSNDKVDYIYSADLYRQYINYLESYLFGGTHTFNYNGISYQYDYLSGHYMDKMFELSLNVLNDQNLNVVLSYFAAIFNFKRSMRFLDYFTGSRTQPLAVGDTSVSVVDGSVSVIDVTKKIQLQRFLNSVNKSGRKFSNYIQQLFGGEVAYDYHNPAFLSHTSDEVGVNVTENTGDAQMTLPNSRTGRFDALSNNYAFEFDSDRPSVVMGIEYFDLPRIYSTVTNRNLFHFDRFDMFNPFMQFIGDQPIYKAELTMLNGNNLDPFAYQLRNMEYKQRVSVCSGGFVENLPSWVFLANADGEVFNHIGPDYIRSRSTELDPYFLSLTGYSRGSYFHFIIAHDNNVEINAPMVYSPSIL